MLEEIKKALRGEASSFTKEEALHLVRSAIRRAKEKQTAART